MVQKRHTSSAETGQVLVIVAVGMLAIVAMVGLVIDGGHAWGRQRETQNGADATAKAGAVVIQQYLGGAPVSGGDVGCAIAGTAAENDVTVAAAAFTDFDGDSVGAVPPCGGGGGIPPGAQGVKTTTEQQFDTFLAGVIGFNQLTASADATAVVGSLTGICPASAGCGVLPITFPRSLDTCDGQTSRTVGMDEWALLNPDAGDTLSGSNLAIMPLCENTGSGASAVGWLDFGCGNLASSISNPCNTYISFPTWLQTKPGNVNSLEGALQGFTGPRPGVPDEADAVVFIPIHDFVCDYNSPPPPDTPVENCPSYPQWSGTGSNTQYHIPYWAAFKMDGAFVGGSDPECGQAPGSPPSSGGGLGCLKGWFMEIVPTRGPISVGRINPGDATNTGILLIQ